MENIIVGEKYCNYCGLTKSLELFRKNGIKYRNQCKTCHNEIYCPKKPKFNCSYVKKDGSICGVSARKQFCWLHNENSKTYRHKFYVENYKVIKV
jgi:hypothetical protein